MGGNAISGDIGRGSGKAPQDRPSYGLCLLIMLLYMVDGIDMQLLGVTVNALSRDWGVPLSRFGGAMAAGHAGAAIGAAIGGLLGDRIGRKPVIIGGTLLFSLPSFAMAFAHTPEHFMILRLMAGLGLGGCLSPALALLVENMPTRYRGISVSMAFLCIPFGIAIAGLSAMALIPRFGWPAMFLLGGALPFILFLLLFKMLPESVSYTAGRSQPAPSRGTFARLLNGEDRGKVWPLLLIFFTCYFAMNMLLSWLPSLMAHIGVLPQIASGGLSAFSFAGMPGILIAGFLMTRWGIRRAVGFYIGGATVALAVLVALLPEYDVSQGTTLLFLMLAFGGFALNGTITTIFAFCTELFPADMRSTAIGLCATAGRVGAIIGAATGAHILEHGGATGFTGTAAGMLAIALLLYVVSARVTRRPAFEQPAQG